MKLFTKKSEWSLLQNHAKNENYSLGFVPTMGALHHGHMALVKKALVENTSVVVSIFVNPTQFDKAEDLHNYPRNLEKDLKLLQELSEEIKVYAPNVEEIYCSELKTEKFDFKGLDRIMEGEFRVGHFEGVATVVKTLFEIIQPDKAYFGEKDFQQLRIIENMVDTFGLAVKIVPCPIQRASDGLALSSRNKRLSVVQLKKATLLYQSLLKARSMYASNSIEDIKKWVVKLFAEDPVLDLEYFAVAEAKSLKIATHKEEQIKYRAFIAVYAGTVRLIDNIALN